MSLDLVQCDTCKAVFITKHDPYGWWGGCSLCNSGNGALRLVTELPDDGQTDPGAA